MRASWEALHASLGRSIRTLLAEKAFREAKQAHPILAGFSDPGAVVAFLSSRLGNLDEKDQILGTLVRLVQRREHHEIASALLWLGLWPGLDVVYRRSLRRYRQQPEELVSDLAAAFIALVERLDLEAVSRVAATLMRSTARDIRDGHKREWEESAPAEHDERAELAFRCGGQIIRASYLDRESRAHWQAHRESPLELSCEADIAVLYGWLEPIVGADAELLIAVLVLEETQREAGQHMGISYDAARKRFQRALRRIRDHLVSPVRDGGGFALYEGDEPSGRDAARAPDSPRQLTHAPASASSAH